MICGAAAAVTPYLREWLQCETARLAVRSIASMYVL